MTQALELAIPYAPHDPGTGSRQKAFHDARYKARYRWLLAGTGSGKTFAAAYEVLSWMLENPPSTALCCEPDHRRIHNTMIPAIETLLGTSIRASPLTLAFNEQAGRWSLVNGWTAWFVPLDEPGREEGPNVSLVWADEIRLVKRWGTETAGTFGGLRRRLRGTGHMGMILSTHSPTEAQEEQARKTEREHTGRMFRWSTLAARRAGTLPIEYDEVIRSYSGRAAAAVLEGKYALPEGLVYDQFDPVQHVQPAPAKRDRTSYGVDWGWTHPACIVAVAWNGESSHVVEEFYGSHYSTQELIEAAKRMMVNWGIGTFHCGADQPAHIAEFRRAGLDAQSYIGKAVDGVNLINDKLKGGTHHVAPECVNLIREKKSYERKPGKEEPEKGDDDAQDAERYAVLGGNVAAREADVL